MSHCGAVTHKNAKTLDTNFYFPYKEENEDEDQLFPFLTNRCVFDSFVFNKVF